MKTARNEAVRLLHESAREGSQRTYTRFSPIPASVELSVWLRVLLDSGAALGGPFLAKSRYHIACGHRKTACSPVLDLSSYGSKSRSLTTTTRPGGRSAPSQWWRGCGRYVRTAWCCDGLTSATPSVDFATPRSLCCSGGGGQSGGAPQIPLKRPRCCGGDVC